VQWRRELRGVRRIEPALLRQQHLQRRRGVRQRLVLTARLLSLWLLPLAGAGCPAGEPASPTATASPLLDGEADVAVDSRAGGGDDAGDAGDAGVEAEAGYAVCPKGIDASFGSIYDLMLSTDTSCGAATAICHSTVGAARTGSLLDLSLDASAVYAQLLGDGGGYPATNINVNPDAGPTLLRVVPGDAGASFLYIKLTIKGYDNRYGFGMPQTNPGSICPPALDAVKTWIDEGAAR
jgi:hypothetical protein